MTERSGLYGSVEKFAQLPLSSEYMQRPHYEGNNDGPHEQTKSTFIMTGNSNWRPLTSNLNNSTALNKGVPNGRRSILRNGNGATSYTPPQETAIAQPFAQQESIYKPTTSIASSSVKTQKTYDKLAEVYSSSDDTAHFVENLERFSAEHVPSSIWILFLLLQIAAGLISIFFGTLNFPLCDAQPLIPVYLIVSGCLLIFNGFVRIVAHIPTPRRRRQGKLVQHLCLYAIELLILVGMVVVVILGCVWVFGAQRVHFTEGIFEQDYCDWTLYWAAYWSVALHLAMFALTIALVFFVLVYGSVVRT